MDSIASFYNNLFTIEITVFGIIAAATFVFLQIVYSQFSYREVYGIFENISLILFLIVGVLTLLLTATGSLLLSFPELNNLAVNDILRNWVMAFSLLFLFLLSLVLFVVFTFSNISYIRPSRIALLISRKVKRDQIRDYLLNKYGIPSPDLWFFQSRPMDFVIVRLAGVDTDEKHEVSEEERAQMESKKRELERQLSDNKKTYEKVKKAVKHAQDPMEALDALMIRAINSMDLGTINEVQSVLLGISADFISNYRNKRDSKEWSPYLGMGRKYLEYLTEIFRVHLSMCDRQKLDSATFKILETSGEIANLVISANLNDLDVMLTFWKEVADNAIGKSREVFSRVIQLYRNFAGYAFEKGIEDNENWLEEIFRHLGWLGERLVSRIGIEEKPLMRDHQYFSEYDQLFEVLLTCSHEYNNKYPTSYPLIYFDFVHVILLQLVSIAKKTQNQRLMENIFSCLYIYSSFAEAAIPKGNSRGAALATIRLRGCYDTLVSEGLRESANEAIGLLVIIGGMAARYKDKLQKVEFVRGGLIDQYIMDIAVTSPFRDKISHTVREAYIRQDTDWDFVVEMGKRLQTNFGFMFDWTTGELYSDDDPRRR
jgi:hypothetical protein